MIFYRSPGQQAAAEESRTVDYAYYGNTISPPQILKLVSPHASL